MFVNIATATRIERAEARLTGAVTEAALASGSAPTAFVHQLGDGVASYLRPDSPMNKLIGVGLATALEPEQLAWVELALAERTEPVRVELCTLAGVEVGASLTARGYHLAGFENVLVRSLATPGVVLAPDIRIERATATTRAAWQEATVTAASCSDETGVPVDQLSRELIDRAVADMLEVSAFDRYLAFSEGGVSGAASMLVQDGIALFSGSATLPARRRRGVQSALLSARLEHARERGAELAVVTTAPGSQSQANVMKHGFTLAYARAILVSGVPRH